MKNNSTFVLLLFFSTLLLFASLPLLLSVNSLQPNNSEFPPKHQSPILAIQHDLDMQAIRSAVSGKTVICSSVRHPACSITSMCSPQEEGAVCEYNVGCSNSIAASTIYICKNGRWVYTDWTQAGYCGFCSK